MRRLCIAVTLLTLVGCATSPTSTTPRKDKELSRTSDLARAAFECNVDGQRLFRGPCGSGGQRHGRGNDGHDACPRSNHR